MKTKKPNPTERFSLEASYSHWVGIANNLEEFANHLKKEVETIQKHLPDSVSYWTMNSRFEDAKTVSEKVRGFVDSQWHKK